jgi:hypothetical protein
VGRRLGIGFLYGILSYPLGVMIGMFLVSRFSSNTHDRSLEAAMTGAFVFGPLAAVIGFLIGLLRSKPGRSASTPESETPSKGDGTWSP